MERNTKMRGRYLSLRSLVSLMLCAIMFSTCWVVNAEETFYLYDTTGYGWICLRSNEQMDVDRDAGAYPDGTKAAVLEV
jgi:hypothetical protein